MQRRVGRRLLVGNGEEGSRFVGLDERGLLRLMEAEIIIRDCNARFFS